MTTESDKPEWQKTYREWDSDPSGYWWIPPGNSPQSKEHRCPLPDISQIPDEHVIGSLWECMKCHQHWLVRYFDAGPEWWGISERRADKLTTESLKRP